MFAVLEPPLLRQSETALSNCVPCRHLFVSNQQVLLLETINLFPSLFGCTYVHFSVVLSQVVVVTASLKRSSNKSKCSVHFFQACSHACTETIKITVCLSVGIRISSSRKAIFIRMEIFRDMTPCRHVAWLPAFTKYGGLFIFKVKWRKKNQCRIFSSDLLRENFIKICWS